MFIEMRTKKQITRRIKLLYYIFFVMVIASVVAGLTGRDFRAGFNTGYQNGRKQQAAGKSEEKRLHRMEFSFIPNDISRQDYDIPVHVSDDGGIRINARMNIFDFEVESSDPIHRPLPAAIACTLLWIAAFVLYLSIFVIIFKILNSLRRSIKNDDLFSRRNITRTRRIGIYLIVASVAFDLGTYIDTLTAARMLEGTRLLPYVGFPITFGNLITGILILFIAEVFAIGYDMSEEQRLTI